jgi:rubrerythrin
MASIVVSPTTFVLTGGLMKSKKIRSIALLGAAFATVGAGVAVASDGEKSHGPKRHAVTSRTEQNLLGAMHGEAFANAQYLAFAAVAKGVGTPSVSALFKRTARVEVRQHFAEEAKLAGIVGTNAQDLRDAINGESYETTTMYPSYAAQAAAQGNSTAAAQFTEIGKDEATHRDWFQAALRSLTGKSKAPAGPASQPAKVSTTGPQATGITLTNLGNAMHGESFAYAKYMLYARHARETGHPDVARLFERTAKVELTQHFREEANLAGLAGATAANLGNAVSGESYEAQTMYPQFAREAQAAGDRSASELFTEIAGDEAKHSRAFTKALNRL